MLTKPGVDLVDGGEVVVPGLGPPSGPVELSALSVVALVAAAGEDRVEENLCQGEGTGRSCLAY